MAVVGANLTGQPLNWQLVERKAKLIETTHTGPGYRLYALADTSPAKPGLVFDGTSPGGIEVEVWEMEEGAFGSFVVLIPAPLGIGTVTLADGRTYDAEQMHAMGAVNEVVDHAELESVALQWAREINGKSPQATRMLKFAFNLLDDGLVGQQVFAGEATRLAYATDEAEEGRSAFIDKRDPNWSAYPWMY